MPYVLRDLIESKDLAQIKINISKNLFSQADFELMFESFTDSKYSQALTSIIDLVMQGEHQHAKEHILQHHFERYVDVLTKSLSSSEKFDQKGLIRFIPKSAEWAVTFINNLANSVAENGKFVDLIIIETIHQSLIFPAIALICSSDLNQNLQNQALIAYSKFIYYTAFCSGNSISSCRPQFNKLLEVCNVNYCDALGNTAAHWLAPINTESIWNVLESMHAQGADFKLENENASTVEDRLSITLLSRYKGLLNQQDIERLLQTAIDNNDVPRINTLLTTAYLDKCDVGKIEEIWFKVLEYEFPERYSNVHRKIISRLLKEPRNHWDNFKLMQGTQSLWLKFTISSLTELMKIFAFEDERFLNAWLAVYNERLGITVFIEKMASSLCQELIPIIRRPIESDNFTLQNAGILKFIVEHGRFCGSFCYSNEIQLLENNSSTAHFTLDMFLATLPGQTESLLEAAARADKIFLILKVFRYKEKHKLDHRNFEMVAVRTLKILADNYLVKCSGRDKFNYDELIKHINSFWFGSEARLMQQAKAINLAIFLDSSPQQSESILEAAARTNDVATILNVFKYRYQQGLHPKNFEQVAAKALRILVDNYCVNNSEEHKKDYHDLLDYLDSFWFGAEARLAKQLYIWHANPTMTHAYSAATSTSDNEPISDTDNESKERERCCRLSPL